MVFLTFIINHRLMISLWIGGCLSDKKAPRAWNKTLAGNMLPRTLDPGYPYFKTCSELYLQNGDKCKLGQFIITKDPVITGLTVIARVEEILQVKGSTADLSGMPDYILLQATEIGQDATSYHMPPISLINRWALVDFKVCTPSYIFECIEMDLNSALANSASSLHC